MRHLITACVILFCICIPAVAQSSSSDDELMAKTRALYDAPFTRDLASFNCAVQFDWKKHFIDTLGVIPPAAMHTAERLQGIQHRVSVDHTQAVVSSTPRTLDLTGLEHGADLEQVLIAMVSSGLNAWLPSSTNVLLPVGTTKYTFETLPTGYKLTMKGQGVTGALLLEPDLRVTSGVMQLPQPMRLTTEFEAGPQGYLLASVKTGPTVDMSSGGEATFAYTYQTVDGYQLPAQVTVTPATTKKWQYILTDCKVVKFIKIQVGLPRH